MARGRMISKSLSTSEKRAALHYVAGKLGEFCQALYPLLIAHADDFGCQQGDVFTIKHLIDPTSPRKPGEFEIALTALHNVGLITWYQAEGKWYVYIRGWFAHQQLKGHEGRKRTFPEPPENPSKFPVSAQSRPDSPKPALREEKRTELKRTEPIWSPEEPATPEGEEEPPEEDPVIPGADVHAFIRRFCELYSQHRHGAKYLVARNKDVPLVKRLLATYGGDRLVLLAEVLLTTDDPWVDQTDRGIGVLSVKASWLDGRLSAYEARHGPLKESA